MLPNENELNYWAVVTLLKNIFVQFSPGLKLGNRISKSGIEKLPSSSRGLLIVIEIFDSEFWRDKCFLFKFELSCGISVAPISSSTGNFFDYQSNVVVLISSNWSLLLFKPVLKFLLEVFIQYLFDVCRQVRNIVAQYYFANCLFVQHRDLD